MEWFMFYRENNKFDDIMGDIDVKKSTYITKFYKHVLLLTETKIAAAILLKYGEDRVPVINFSDRFSI